MPSKKQIEKALYKEKEILAMEEKMREDKSWNVGVNKRSKMREQKMNIKEEEKLKKKKEMKQLIEKDENEMNNYPRPSTSRGKKDKFDLLSESLANACKTKPQIDQERKLLEKESRKFEQLRLEKEKERRIEKELEIEKNYKKKNIVRQKGLIDIPKNNRLEPICEEKSIYATGIDDALELLDDDELKKSEKTTYHEFYERNLPIVEMQLPNLRLSQYKDKIQKMWKISYENPNNNF